MKKSESGRSMVEMLGTLAIIGVLSIGGIAGYSYGMDKYRANQTMNEITLRSVDLMAQINNGNDNLTLDNWKNEKTTYPISLVFDEDTYSPLIQVSNVPERVCEMIVKGMATQAAITVNSYYTIGQEDGGCEDENNLTFYFGDHEACGTNYCSGNTPVCHAESQTCVKCVNSSDCPSDKPVCNTSNICEACPAETPIWDSSSKQCTGCETNDDCADGYLCFPATKKCWTYSEHPINGTPGWVHVKVKNSTNTGNYDNAKFICDYLGMQLPVPKDFMPNWDGKTLCEAGEYSEIANTILGNVPSMGENERIWTSESRGVGINQFWDYQIIFRRRDNYSTPACIGLYNVHKNDYAMTVCKP